MHSVVTSACEGLLTHHHVAAMDAQVQITHGQNKISKKKRAVAAAKEVIVSNNEGFRSVHVKPVPANTRVITRCPKKVNKPFYIGTLLEATDPTKDGNHLIKIQWWTAEKLPEQTVTCYQGPDL